MPLLFNFTPGQSHGMSKLLAFIKTHLIFRREYLKMRGERKVHNLLSVTTGGEKRQQARKSLGLRRKSQPKEKEWRKPNVLKQASPSQSVHCVQLADLVTSARGGGGGIEGGRGGERKWRRRRGGSVDRWVAVCGIGTLSGSWRGWGRLNHPWQWSVTGTKWLVRRI